MLGSGLRLLKSYVKEIEGFDENVSMWQWMEDRAVRVDGWSDVSGWMMRALRDVRVQLSTL